MSAAIVDPALDLHRKAMVGPSKIYAPLSRGRKDMLTLIAVKASRLELKG